MSRKQTRPNCLSCCGKKARPGKKFCSDRCAADEAEQLYADQKFCFSCQRWHESGRFGSNETCIHCRWPQPTSVYTLIEQNNRKARDAEIDAQVERDAEILTQMGR